ncbi:MAG TPA: hypothetical protein VKV05_05005, partial [Terriglobales bacterium]|nr:hypothetical protein [Terriglobales bacterium]
MIATPKTGTGVTDSNSHKRHPDTLTPESDAVGIYPGADSSLNVEKIGGLERVCGPEGSSCIGVRLS